MPLHPDLRALLDATPPEARLDMSSFPLEEGVRRLRSRPAPLINVPGAVPTEDIRVPGAEGDLPARLYRPANPHGMVIHFHGGGWVTGTIAQDDFFCQALARDAACTVVSLDYRLAPEHAFPKPLDDCFAATRWAAANAERVGGVGAKLAVSGISAGGNLAAAVTLMARDLGGPKIDFQSLMYPVCDGGMDFPSCQENAEGYHLTSAAMEWFWQRYAPTPEQRFHPLASVLRAPSLERLPPAVVMTCEFDPLRDEGNAYAKRLAESGIPVLHRQLPGLIHGFLRMGWNQPWGQQPVSVLASALREAMA